VAEDLKVFEQTAEFLLYIGVDVALQNAACFEESDVVKTLVTG
jgi:hypothetical protein